MQYDVAICGGGIVGMATALSLVRQQKKVCIISPKYQPLIFTNDDYHPRIYAISGASKKLLEDLGVWSNIPVERYQAVERMEIHGDGDGLLELDAWQANSSELTWIMESGQIENVLMQALRYLNVTWIDAQVVGYEKGSLTASDGKTYTADLCVGADGANSKLRELAGLSHTKRMYGDIGLVCQLNTAFPHQSTAYQWFRTDGILAFLPLPDTADGPQVSMVWSLRTPQAEEWLQKTPQEISEQLPAILQSMTQHRLGTMSVRSELKGFPLTLQETQLAGNGVVLMGDAAHRLHPLAGQGLNLGLGDVYSLSHILATKEHFRNCGDERILDRYRDSRKRDILEMKLATDGLHKLFASPDMMVSKVRNLGLNMVQNFPWVKRKLIEAAIGLKKIDARYQ
ncbi:FAD-dependent monooxygenase [Basilea psittacipulmonis]|uniref:FAD-binding domain-containing protein n=1 Tax=Basilea psittacipulmonis DSM 24701 TaxID=1072685 RepID=A0A077DFG7_9BURK|nr:FAD-dependent monooxygenase [Basilea psittacipulmonis]AIL32117.1 hypothetical protein IX83_01170 [Basilea psittacipulmonis DSM 24701]